MRCEEGPCACPYSTRLPLISVYHDSGKHIFYCLAFSPKKGAIFGYWTVYLNRRKAQTWYALESKEMYEDVRRYQNLRNLRKERFLRMQTLTRPSFSPTNNNTGDSQALRVAVMAAILFALSGLITGFAFGAFVHFSPAKSDNLTTSINTSQQKTGSGKTPTTRPKMNPVALGVPDTSISASAEIADGSTPYTVTTQVTSQIKSNPALRGPNLQTSGITCKIWLTKEPSVSAMLRANDNQIPRSIDTLAQTFPDEIQGGLNFASNTLQTQMCDSSGQAHWSYTINPSVKPGHYTLAVITDWNGQHYNWGWQYITIKQAD